MVGNEFAGITEWLAVLHCTGPYSILKRWKQMSIDWEEEKADQVALTTYLMAGVWESKLKLYLVVKYILDSTVWIVSRKLSGLDTLLQ